MPQQQRKWDTLQSLKQNKEGLQKALAQKKEIWDKNKLELSAQKLYIETSTLCVEYDFKALEMRNILLNLLTR